MQFSGSSRILRRQRLSGRPERPARPPRVRVERESERPSTRPVAQDLFTWGQHQEQRPGDLPPRKRLKISNSSFGGTPLRDAGGRGKAHGRFNDYYQIAGTRTLGGGASIRRSPSVRKNRAFFIGIVLLAVAYTVIKLSAE